MGNSFWFILYLSQVFFLECSVHPRWIKHDQAQGMRFIGLDSSPYWKGTIFAGAKIQWDFHLCFAMGPSTGMFQGELQLEKRIEFPNGP